MAFLFPWQPYSRWDVARNGRMDGRKGIPTIEQEKQPPFIMNLKQFAEENISRLAQGWRATDARLLAQYCKAKQNTELSQQWLTKAKSEVETSRKDEATAREEYVKHFHLTPFWYIVLMIAVALAEIPLNAIVFQLFGEQKSFTLIVALSLAIILPLSAHFLGGQLRHGFLKDDEFSAHTIGIACLILTVLTVLGGIAYLREKFFEGAGVQQLLGIQMDATLVTVIFFTINLLIFIASTTAAYVSHNSTARKYLLARRAATKLLKNAQKRVHLLEKRIVENQNLMHEAAAGREKELRGAINQAEEVKNIAQKLMTVYQAHNLRQRPKADMPKCFENYPPIDIPLDLQPEKITLVWECRGILPEAPVVSTPSQTTDVSPLPTTESQAIS